MQNYLLVLEEKCKPNPTCGDQKSPGFAYKTSEIKLRVSQFASNQINNISDRLKVFVINFIEIETYSKGFLKIKDKSHCINRIHTQTKNVLIIKKLRFVNVMQEFRNYSLSCIFDFF